MIKSITLQNYRSFGAKQTIPLQPITVLVGPNNAGKSSFISIGTFVQTIAGNTLEIISSGEVGDTTNVVHRPPAADGSFVVEWETDRGSYGSKTRPVGNTMRFIDERLRHNDRGDAWAPSTELRGGKSEPILRSNVSNTTWEPGPFRGFFATLRHRDPPLNSFAEVLSPLIQSREVKLSLGALRTDARFETRPQLGPNGGNMASVVSLWRSSRPEQAEALDAIMRSSIPEIRHVLAMPAPEGQAYRLWFRQTDDQMFDAFHVSDGVLLFTALAMHAIDAGPGSVVFLEEPEHSIHPTRLHDIVELLRRMVQEKGCQFVIATHSPVLLSEFRDEPEAILLFRRGEQGTLVTPLSEVPRLVNALRKADPGEMLSNGFFNDPI